MGLTSLGRPILVRREMLQRRVLPSVHRPPKPRVSYTPNPFDQPGAHRRPGTISSIRVDSGLYIGPFRDESTDKAAQGGPSAMTACIGKQISWGRSLRCSKLEPLKIGEGQAGSSAASLKKGVSVAESLGSGLLDPSTPHVVASNCNWCFLASFTTHFTEDLTPGDHKIYA